MTVSNVYGRYALEVHTDDDVSAALLGGVTDFNERINSDVRAEPTSGEEFGRHIAVYGQKPAADLTLLNCAAALDVIGLTGKRILGATNPGVRVWQVKWADGERIASGAVHRYHRIRKGIIVPRTLSCTHQQDAQLGYDLLYTYDTTNEPITLHETQSLPAGIADDERFTIGKLTVGGIVLDQIKSVEFDWGLDARTEGADSDIWDTHARLRVLAPTIRVRGIDPEWFAAAAVPLVGVVATHANSSFYFRKRAQDANHFVANGTAQHIKLTFDGIATIETAHAESGEEAAETELVITTRYDGTNLPVVVNTASAIT